MLYKLKAKRVEKGIRQEDFAKRLGISRQNLISIEQGKSEPRRNLMIKIAKELDCTVNELFFY